MTDDRCPCGCGLIDDAAQRGFYQGYEEFLALHLAWHRMLNAIRLAIDYNIFMGINWWRRLWRRDP